MDSRTRLLYIAPQSPVPGNVVTELRLDYTYTARHSRRGARERACGARGACSERLAAGERARGRVRAAERSSGDARTQRGAVRDERSHGPAPTHDSLRRNDEAAGYARALYDAASRICPIGYEISRGRGEQTRHASPSNTVTRLKRI